MNDPSLSAFWRPGVSEQVIYSKASQVEVPYAQARLVFLLRFVQIVSLLVAVVLLAVGAYALSNGYNVWGYAAFGIVMLMVLATWAGHRPYALLIQRMEVEIVDPHRDSDARIIMGDYHERMLAQQKQKPVAPPTLRVEVNNGKGQWKFADLPAPSSKALVWFARDVLNDYTDGALSERTANHHGFSRFQWQDLRDTLLSMQAAQWRHPSEPRQGIVLTDMGEQVLAEIARTTLAEVRQ